MSKKQSESSTARYAGLVIFSILCCVIFFGWRVANDKSNTEMITKSSTNAHDIYTAEISRGPLAHEDSIFTDGAKPFTDSTSMGDKSNPTEIVTPTELFTDEQIYVFDTKPETKTQVPAKRSSTSYTVKQGDTLTAISQKIFGTASYADAIFKENAKAMLTRESLWPGMTIKIPTTTDRSSVSTSANEVIHTVKPMETITSICARYYSGKTSKLYLNLVRMSNAATLKSGVKVLPGMRLKIPADPLSTGTIKTQKPVAPKSYTVQSGDTLSSIARQLYGRSDAWKKIFAANSDLITDPAQISEGVVLRLP